MGDFRRTIAEFSRISKERVKKAGGREVHLSLYNSRIKGQSVRSSRGGNLGEGVTMEIRCGVVNANCRLGSAQLLVSDPIQHGQARVD